jgi:hypothetical protein
MADRLDLPVLQDLAAWKYGDALDLGENTSALPTSIALILKETRESDRKLRDIAVEFVGECGSKLLKRDGFILLLKDNPDLLLEIYQSSMEQLSFGSRGCPWKNSGCNDSIVRLEKTSRAYSKAWKEAKATGGKEWFCINCDRAFGMEDMLDVA